MNKQYSLAIIILIGLSITGSASAVSTTKSEIALTALESSITKTDKMPPGESQTTEKQLAEIKEPEALAAATPQPPLVTPDKKPSYGPETTQKKTLEEAPVTETGNSESERRINNTPQPPLIDTQKKTSYEPPSPSDGQGSNFESDIVDKNKKNLEDQAGDDDSIGIPDKTAEEDLQAGPSSDVATPANSEITTETSTTDKESPAEKEEKKKRRKRWTETYPVSVNADWLQLKSGEWLRGRIIVMQKELLEFDSDELDDLAIKWKNVKYIKSHQPYSLRFNSLGRTPVVGAIEIIEDKVHVKTDYDDKVYDRHDLNTIASGQETEIGYWKTKVTFSINIRKGNTDQTDFTSKISAKRRTTNSRFILDYLGNFTKVQETETINNHRLNEALDIFLTRDLYWTPIFAEIYRDPFQNIERRLKVGIGIGYSLINSSTTEWDISTGPAYQETRFVSVQSDTDKIDGTFALMLGTNFNTELNARVDIEGLYSITLGDKETGGYTHHSLLTIETELNDRLNFDVTGVWDYVRKPVADKDGLIPEKDDFRIMIGLGYDL